jgi:hypothetical protein
MARTRFNRVAPEQTDAPKSRLVRVLEMEDRSSRLGDPGRSTNEEAMEKTRVVKTVIGVLFLGVILGSAALGAVLFRIDQSVREYCAVAQQAYPHPGDDVAALSDLMNSESHSLRDRNLAIWTLGRLCEAKALPALQRAYTGGECDHDQSLCQYELEKAIKLCGGVPKRRRDSHH